MNTILITYYSYSGNTREIAREIQSVTGGELHEIIPVRNYPVEYNECIIQARKDIENNYRPELAGTFHDLSGYELVFVGTPNWWDHLATPVASFLNRYDFTGKTIVPFCTHSGAGKGNIFEEVKTMTPGSGHLEGFSMHGNKNICTRREVEEWLYQIR